MFFTPSLCFFSQNQYIIGKKSILFGGEKEMRNFDYSHLKDRTWDNEILSYVAKIHEFKGKQELYFRQKPVELERLVEDKTIYRNRDEREILGY